jgi:hypothetical protein
LRLRTENRSVPELQAELSVQATQPVTASRPAPTDTRLGAGWALARERLATTPGRLVLLAVLVITGAVCFGVIASVAERARAHAAQAVQAQTEPLLVQAVNLYAALSDANATATTTFLLGGLEPPGRRAHYLRDLRFASTSLAALTRGAGEAAGTRGAVRTIGQELPIYSGLVEAARANNRQGFPVGSAYLRQASALLADTILPAASHLYASEARALSDDYAAGAETVVLVVLAVTALVALALLGASQRYLARISRRVFNIPMLLATVVLVGIAAWALIGVIDEQNALAAAHRDSDAVEVLSASRILLSRARSDESLALVGRGSDEISPVDFTRVRRALAPPSGLLAEAGTLAVRVGAGAADSRLVREFASFMRSPASARVADRLDATLDGQIAAAQAQFAQDAADARSALSGLAVAIPVLILAAAALALLGVRQRLEEYR